MDQNFEIRIVISENFLKFSRRRRAVRLWPIWTIMVAAKLDHNRVLVTKFHKNRSTLKVEVPVRHTDRQTDRQTRLKIRALQVCNRANNIYTDYKSQTYGSITDWASRRLQLTKQNFGWDTPQSPILQCHYA